MSLPAEIRIFVNSQTAGEEFLQITESNEDAYVEAAGGGEDTIVGVYELKRRVRLKFSVNEEPLGT